MPGGKHDKADSLALVIPSLAGGGAERVMARLANHWAETRGPVTLVTFYGSEEDHPLDARIRRLFINEMPEGPAEDRDELWPGQRSVVRKLRRALLESGAGRAVSFLSRMNLRTLLAAPAHIRVAVAERSYPPLRPLPDEEETLRRRLYPQAHALAVLTERTARDWAHAFMPRDKVHVIPNPARPFGPDKGDAGESTAVPAEYIAACGRLVSLKGFDRLLRAFASFHRLFPGPGLVLIGDGPELASLKCLARELGLEGVVLFTGHLRRPEAVMRNALFFVLSSRVEGFPNALLDALASGMPCIAADCPTGPAEMIEHGRNGLLYPPDNVEALAAHMANLYKEKGLRDSLGANAAILAGRYAEKDMAEKWAALF